MLPLRTLCENVLLRHHLALRELGDVRYGLIKRVLHKFTSQQLLNLEQLNPFLVLEDDDIWLGLLKRDYPQDVHDKYTTQPGDVKRFYKRQMKAMGVDPNGFNVDGYIQLPVVNSRQYRLPYKQVYIDIRQHYLEKQEEAIVNLRKNMRKLEKSKDVNRVIHLDEVIPVGRALPVKKPDTRSPLFQKAQIEARKRRQLFRNPSSLAPPPPPPPPTPGAANRISRTSLRVQASSVTASSTSSHRTAPSARHSTETLPSNSLPPSARSPPSSRTRPSSIFVPKKPHKPQRRMATKPTEPLLDLAWQDQERAVKRIRLGDYIKRKKI